MDRLLAGLGGWAELLYPVLGGHCSFGQRAGEHETRVFSASFWVRYFWPPGMGVRCHLAMAELALFAYDRH
jgi:hypothetical protein